MTQSSFFESIHCQSSLHCGTCRSKDAGREWRRGFCDQFEDLVQIDFECPHGKDWQEPQPQPAGLGDEIKAITSAVGIKPCNSCNERARKLNQLSPPDSLLTRMAKTVRKWIKPDGQDRQNFDRWEINTGQVAPFGSVEAGSSEFPVVSWNDQFQKPKPHTFVWVYVARLAESDEIQYSIRSVRKFVPDAEIVICGDRPKGFDGPVIHSPRVTARSVRKRFGYRPSLRFIKWVDSIVKLQAIIESPYVSDDFLWMYDDTFLCRPTTFEELAIPRYSRPSVSVNRTEFHRRKDDWKEVRRRTFNDLDQHGLPTADYSTHFPTAYNKRLLQKTIAEFAPWKRPRLIESLYLNHHSSPKARPVWRDLTYVKKQTLDRLDRDNHFVINVGHKAWHDCRPLIDSILEGTGTP